MVWPVSDRFRATAVQGGQLAVLVEVLQQSQPVATVVGPSGLSTSQGSFAAADLGARRAAGRWNETELATLQLVDGSVRMRRGFTAVRTCDVTLAGWGLDPKDADDLLHPASGHELRVWRGYTFSDGSAELVPLGVFQIARARTARPRQGIVSVTVTGYDRGRTVRRHGFAGPDVTPSGASASEVIRELLLDAVPWADVDLPSTSAVPELVYDVGDDRWGEAQALADTFRSDLYWDGLGTARTRPEPDPDNPGDPVWDFIEGAGSLLLDYERDLDNEEGYNRVVVEANNDELDHPLRAVATNLDPSSDTYARGPYGVVQAEPIRRTNISTRRQANRVAEAALARQAGIVDSVPIVTVPLPQLEPGDPVYIRAGNIDRIELIETVEVPLTTGPDQTLDVYHGPGPQPFTVGPGPTSGLGDTTRRTRRQTEPGQEAFAAPVDPSGGSGSTRTSQSDGQATHAVGMSGGSQQTMTTRRTRKPSGDSYAVGV